MTRPRNELVSIDNTPYYHITSRCVRRTYLCGVDSQTNISYEHRRQWIVEHTRLLSSVFAIDIAREANKEDSCTGHFWKSRYQSQALLSEEALVSAMAYVD